MRSLDGDIGKVAEPGLKAAFLWGQQAVGGGTQRGVCGQREEGECGQAGFPRTVPAHGCPRSPWLNGRWHPYLQDAPPLVLLVLREHVSGEEGVAVEADAVGPIVVIFELSPVVGAPGTHHLREEGRGLGPSVRWGNHVAPWLGAGLGE